MTKLALMKKGGRFSGKRQTGAALLVLMTALLLVIGYATLQVVTAHEYKQRRQQEITNSLAFAKDALIGYAVNYVDNYGHNIRGGVGRLPCPSKTKYGSPASTCGSNSVGFLPGVWKRDGKWIDIDHLEKFLDQDLWYALSEDYRFNPSFNRLNSNSGENLLSVDNDDQVVAVIFAPGDAVKNQQRGGGVYSVKDYLESENADSDGVFSTVSDDSNDRLVTITRSELVPLMERRTLGYAKDWLLEYKAEYEHFPYAAPFGDADGACEEGLLKGKLAMERGNCSGESLGEFVSEHVPKNRSISQTWFQYNRWADLVFYHVDEKCTSKADITLCDGVDDPMSLLTVNNSPANALLVSVGQAIHTEYLQAVQLRDEPVSAELPDMVNYFDTAELLTAEINYDLQRLDSMLWSRVMSNDQYLVIR